MCSLFFTLIHLMVFASSFCTALEVNTSSIALDAACFVDSDANGVLTKNELAEKISSTLLAVSPASILTTWDSWQCPEFKTYDIKPSFLHHLLSMIFIRTGRFSWDPCRIALTQRLGSYYDFNTGDITSITTDDFVLLLSYFLSTCLFIVRTWDVAPGADSCMRQAKYDRFSTEDKGDYLQRLSLYSRSTAFVDWARSLSIPNFSDYVDNASCVLPYAYAERTCKSVESSMRNFSAPCNITEQLGEFDDEDEVVPTTLIVVLCLVALCAFVSCCLGTRLFKKSRRQHEMLDQSHQVQQLLKAKIDAWVLLDSNLQAEASSLQPEFKYRLDIAIPDQEQFDLFDIVHPDDFESLLAAHDQLKRDAEATGSPPIVQKLRLRYHATVGPRKDYEVQYLPVELVLAANSRGQVCAGLTVLAEVVLESTQPDLTLHDAMFMKEPVCDVIEDVTEDASQVQSRASLGEMILNGSDALSCNESAAATFVSMEANDHAGGQVTFRYHQEKMAALQQQISTLYGRGVDEPPPPATISM
eukprot:TRINITY_DN4651_c1_g2_i1.p1 TRINITY_DN4651_c1_g2~~TRINITY_DN4651_c1_g2_i1.p1  ORF type:complete len:529 (+),score=64.59 TRINITY_DN4651_c1_g2_i1:92-1678(+)